jgi:dextranase
MQADATVSVVPDKAFYYPGEPATFLVAATGGTRVEATITHLVETVDTPGTALTQGTATLTWRPPAVAPRGYGLTVRLLDQDGNLLTTASTAFDVLDNWTQAPRYGFLSQFEPGRDNVEATMEWDTRYHVNGLQFYDWQYRHENLLPSDETYTDLLGRRMSLETVARLIEAAHARHIAAMPYTAIYGASVAFYQDHPTWALFQRADHPYEFGDHFLIIMDPSPGSPWADHLLGQFARVLDELDFDGIQLDQYGAPKIGYNAAGERVDLAQAIPAFIDQTAQVVREHRDRGAVIFNAVGNWPIQTVAPADQDAVYIEVWKPYRDFMDLHRLIAGAENLGGGKPVIIAAYIPPERLYNVRLADAIIFASGGYHLELGEPGAMLADPYFPRFGLMDEATQAIMQRYYDFLVRYEEVLSLDTADTTGSRAKALTISGLETQKLLSKDKVAVIVRQGPDFETFSLVNLMGIDSGRWDTALPDGPDALADLPVRIHTDRPVVRAWLASPDGGSLDAQPIQPAIGEDDAGPYVAFELPHLDYWTMIVLEY